MRTPSRILLGLTATAALAGSMAMPAMAADTTATVAVEAGTISLTAPAAVDLGAITPGETTSAVLSGMTVTDDRAGELGWVASVSIGDFANGTGSDSIAASAASYVAGQAVTTGTSVVTASSVIAGVPGAVQTATGVAGNNSATWDATVEVAAPADTLAGTYTSTIVHSVV